MTKLEDIRKELNKNGIPAEIKDYSRKDKTFEELIEDIAEANRDIEKWMQKGDAVMVAIISARIGRLLKELGSKMDIRIW